MHLTQYTICEQQALQDAMQTVAVNCRTEIRNAQQLVSTAAREAAQRHLIAEAAPPAPDALADPAAAAPGTASTSSSGGAVGTLAAPALPGIHQALAAGTGGSGPVAQVALEEEEARAVQGAARAAEALGPGLVGEIVLGFVRGAAYHFFVQWAANDASPDALWSSSLCLV